MGKNQSEAYRIAYPGSVKWKDDAVWVNSSQMVADAKVRLRIDELKARHLKRNEMTVDKILQNMKEWVEFDPLELMDEQDCVKSMRDLAPEIRKSLASIEVSEIWSGKGEARRKIGELKKIKFIDKRATADMFMKVFGAYAKEPLLGKDDIENLRDILKDIL
jgi:hypothetical protein